MGFALLAGVPPVYGLYSSILPGWVYYVFGTSRHLSVGTMALTALMVGAVVARTVPGVYSLCFSWTRVSLHPTNYHAQDRGADPQGADDVHDIVRMEYDLKYSCVRIGVCYQSYFVNGEFRYKSNPTRWLRITRQQVKL